MDDRGYYNGFGGAYLPEILVATFDQLDAVPDAMFAIPEGLTPIKRPAGFKVPK